MRSSETVRQTNINTFRVPNSYRNHHAKFDIDRTIITKLTKKAIRYVRADVRTDPNYGKALLLKMFLISNLNCLVQTISVKSFRQ